MRAKITVYPRPEILDPQGTAIRAALGRLGFSEVHEVRAGKSFDVELDAASPAAARERLEAMCEALFVNRVVEDFAIEIVDGEA